MCVCTACTFVWQVEMVLNGCLTGGDGAWQVERRSEDCCSNAQHHCIQVTMTTVMFCSLSLKKLVVFFVMLYFVNVFLLPVCRNKDYIGFSALTLLVRKGIWLVRNWVMWCWRGYLSGARCKWFACGPADATATPSSIASLKPRMVYLSGAGLPGLSWKTHTHTWTVPSETMDRLSLLSMSESVSEPTPFRQFFPVISCALLFEKFNFDG